jgi:hypothetical protein
MLNRNLHVALLAALILFTGVVWAQYPGGGDSGQYVIISAQYGTAEHHVDVTARLKELARQDRAIRMGNNTFGVDPDPGHVKTLRIYARDPRGEERMFEYRENSLVDGSQFRGWGTGQWGTEPWHGRWEGYQRGRNVSQPEMSAAMENLQQAAQNLERAAHNKGGHRAKALELVQQAMREVQAGIQYDDTH